jgi:hypothetical protein
MKTEPTPLKAAQHYERARAQQYAQHDLLAVLRSHGEVMTLQPDAPEAGYSRTQILGIASRVVPAEELLAAQTDLALRHLDAGVETTTASSR